MKINPLGIQSYQQVEKRDNSAAQTALDNLKTQEKTVETKVKLDPQDRLTGSKLSVQAPKGSYADMLSVEERQALDLLFNKFKDSERFGAGFDISKPAINKQTVGNLVDIKV